MKPWALQAPFHLPAKHGYKQLDGAVFHAILTMSFHSSSYETKSKSPILSTSAYNKTACDRPCVYTNVTDTAHLIHPFYGDGEQETPYTLFAYKTALGQDPRFMPSSRGRFVASSHPRHPYHFFPNGGARGQIAHHSTTATGRCFRMKIVNAENVWCLNCGVTGCLVRSCPNLKDHARTERILPSWFRTKDIERPHSSVVDMALFPTDADTSEISEVVVASALVHD